MAGTLTYTHPNALLQQIRADQQMEEALDIAHALGMDILGSTIFGTREQWEEMQRRLSEECDE